MMKCILQFIIVSLWSQLNYEEPVKYTAVEGLADYEEIAYHSHSAITQR